MNKRLRLISGILTGTLMTSGVVFSKNIQETINAVYMNVRLVIDGEEIIPKDPDGKIVEPFIYNGTTYLPIRAIGEAFNKDVHWDGETATVYVGDIVKPAKEIYLYDKPYLECKIPKEFVAGKEKILENFGNGDFNRNYNKYVGFSLVTRENPSDLGLGEQFYNNSVTYALNGTAKSVKGTLIAPAFNNCDSAEYSVNFYNESGKLLYQSPIMTESVSPIDFEFDTGKALKLKVEFNGHSDHGTYNFICRINDFAILTTDY